MTDCDYCDSDFSSKKEKLDHELSEHKDEMTSHEKGDKKSELNKLEQKTQTNKHKKRKDLQFAGIALLFVGLVAGGGYFAYNNLGVGGGTANESIGVGSPVHWHADYEISVCGEDRVLQGGPITAHTHGEKTFHMEGVREREEQAKLDWIVDQLGGEMEENSIFGKEECNGEPGDLTVQANGEELEDPLNYVVRDGDFIRITYS